MINLKLPGISPGNRAAAEAGTKRAEGKIRNVAGEKVLLHVREADIGVFTHSDGGAKLVLRAMPEGKPESAYDAILARVVDDEEGHFLALEIELKGKDLL